MPAAMTHFNAPWGPSVWVPTALSSAVIGAVAVSLSISSGTIWAALPPLMAIALSAPFIIRGYTVTRDDILVRRLLWPTRISRHGLRSATFEPFVVRRSWRFGNGGMFAVSGWFRNATLGWYQAFVTDSRRAVVLRFAGKTVVVSPDDPARFINEVLGRTATLDWSAEASAATELTRIR